MTIKIDKKDRENFGRMMRRFNNAVQRSQVLTIAKKNKEQYYINTGTWRNVIPATRKFKHFGRLKALTKVILFYPRERKALSNERDWSFQYMSGVSFGEHRHLQS